MVLKLLFIGWLLSQKWYVVCGITADAVPSRLGPRQAWVTCWVQPEVWGGGVYPIPSDSGRLWQEDCELQVVLGNIVRPCLKKNQSWWCAPVVAAGRLGKRVTTWWDCLKKPEYPWTVHTGVRWLVLHTGSVAFMVELQSWIAWSRTPSLPSIDCVWHWVIYPTSLCVRFYLQWEIILTS